MLLQCFHLFREVKLSPSDVDRAFELLKRFSGDQEDKHVLKDILWIERMLSMLLNIILPYVFVTKNNNVVLCLCY